MGEEERSFQEVVLHLSDEVGLKLVVREGSTIASLQEALEVFFPRQPCNHWYFSADGEKLAAGDVVPAKLTLCVQQSDGVKPAPTRQAYSRSHTNPTPPDRRVPPSQPSTATRKPDPPRKKDPVAVRPNRDSSASVPSPPRRPVSGGPAAGDAPSLEEARKALGQHLQSTDLRRLQKASKEEGKSVASLMHAVLIAIGYSRPTPDAISRELMDMQFVTKVRQCEPPAQDRVIRRLEDHIEAASPAHHEELRKGAGPGAVALAQWLIVLNESARAGGFSASKASLLNGVGEAAPDRPAPVRPSRTQKKPSPPPPPVAAAPAPALSSQMPEETAAGLSAAVEALQALKMKDLREVRSYERPPAHVKTILGLALTLLGRRDHSWEAVKKETQNTKGFVDMLCKAKFEELPKNLGRAQVRGVQKSINELTATQDSVKHDATPAAAQAVQAIHQWVEAVWAVFPKGVAEEGEAPPARSGSHATAAKDAAADRQEPPGPQEQEVKEEPESNAEQVVKEEVEVEPEVKEELEVEPKEHEEEQGGIPPEVAPGGPGEPEESPAAVPAEEELKEEQGGIPPEATQGGPGEPEESPAAVPAEEVEAAVPAEEGEPDAGQATEETIYQDEY